jgi:hypothetical protein
MTDDHNKAPSPIYRDAAGHEAHPITPNPSDDAVTEFVDTVNALGIDGRWLVGGLTDFLRRQKRSEGPGMTAEERKFVNESGAMTEAQLVASERSVARGSLEKSAGELWLGTYQETWSANTAARFLGWTQNEVLAAAEEQRIYGIPV